MRGRLAALASGVVAVGTKELRGRMRGPRAFIGVTVYLAVLAGVSLLVYSVQKDLAAGQASFSGGNPYASAQIGQALFSTLLFLQVLLVVFLAPAATSGAISLERVAQDGMRVRADAGAASFRRKASLQDNLEQARARVRELKEQLDADPAQASRRKAAAQERARREMQQRLQQALERLPELEQIKRRNGAKAEDARASSTDADASVMKMADGGYRPAVNAQMASDCDSQVIVGVEVSTAGSDMAQLAPMVDQVGQRCGKTPEQWLVDGGFPAHEQIDAVADKTEVYAPVPEPRAKKDEQGNEVEQDKHAPKPDDSTAVAQWRQRMARPEAKALYKLRAATAECVNAQARNRGLQRMPVRGLGKMRCVVLLFALAHNLMRMLALAPQLLGLGPTPSIATAATV